MSPEIHHDAHPSTVFTVIQHAAPPQQIMMIALVAAILAAVAVLALKLASGRRLSGGSAFLSGLRFGGPIVGLLGACYSGFSMTLGIVNVGIEPTLRLLAPGIAESFLILGLGLLSGAFAVVAHWAVESRIDRQVLGV